MSLNQSCGKCVPCRDGLSEVDRLFGSVISGDATEETLVKMKDLCEMIASTADCAVGVVAATTVLDSLREFADEYESHVRDRRCVENVEQTVPCMTLCPAHVAVHRRRSYRHARDARRRSRPRQGPAVHRPVPSGRGTAGCGIPVHSYHRAHPQSVQRGVHDAPFSGAR